MRAELIKTFRFDAAHSLSGVPASHKCSRMHGHSYRLDVHVEGPVNEKSGMVIDFGDIQRFVRPVVDELDHHLLNEIKGLENSTSENLCRYLWDRLKPVIPMLSAITIWESESARCVYRGE